VAASIAMLARDAIDWGWYAAFPGGLAASRFSAICRDVNAAGSYYALAFGAAVGLAASDRRLRVLWAPVAGLAVLGIWLTGSRAALAAVALVAVIAAIATVRVAARKGVRTAIGPVAVALGLAVLAGIHWYSTVHVRTGASVALEWRIHHGGTAVRMFESHPLFGVGIGRFQALSSRYASPGWKRRGNAHNNFLQMLGELGLIGLGLMVWLVGSTLWRCWRGRGEARSGPLLACLAGGTVAFLLTWLAGHPMLVFEAALAFWLAMGLLLGLVPAGGPPRPRVLPWLIALFIAASVVPRARAEIAAADLSRTWTAFSSQHVERDGTPFRWMGDRAQLFVPSSAREVAIPFRSPNGAAAIKVLVNGQGRARLVASGRRWSEALVRLDGSDRRRFVPLELRAAVLLAPGQHDGRVQVGAPRVAR